MIRVPCIDYRQAPEGAGGIGYHVGVALDELVAFAREEGCPEHELAERFEESLERFEEES